MSNPFREIYLEALKGNQHKLDVDKDGKVEGEDLAKLRAKKMKEEVEELDELDKKTLASYAYKAAGDATDKARESERRASSAKDAEKRAKDPKLAFAKSANQAVQKHEMGKSADASKKSAKRLSGVLKAASKLAYKEEVEQIDEVEKATGNLKDACWKGYTAVGMKMKNGKKVPNCVPVKEEEINELTDDQIKKLRSDAADHAKKSIDKQSDDRIAKLKSDKEDSKKGFFHKVGQKQINMVKGAVKGLMKKEATDVPFDGPYTKSKPVKNSDGTTQSPMSRARELAKQALAKKKMKEEVELQESNPHKSVAAEIKAGTFKSYSPTAPVPDKKYIKGTPENKAYKATKKPINGHPTNEEVEQIDELDQKTLKSYVNKNLKSGDTSAKRDDGLYRATNKIAKKQATSTLDKKVKTLGNKRPSETKNRYEYEASRSELKNRGIHNFAGRRTRTEEVELDEANHREFASQGKMHPDMAKHMSVGSEHDYYEHGTGDKVSGKVMHKSATEVHMKQTHDSYDPKKKGTVHKFKISNKLEEETTMEFTQEELQLIGQFIEIAEKMNMTKASMGDVIKDFKKSDAPQFAGKSMEKRRQMAIAAKLSADRGTKKEEVELVSFKGFNLDEIKMSDLPSRKVTGKYGTEYYKGEKDKDEKGYDADDEKESSTEKRGRGRPKGSASGARQKGSTPKKKGSGVEMTGYPLHLPNSR